MLYYNEGCLLRNPYFVAFAELEARTAKICICAEWSDPVTYGIYCVSITSTDLRFITGDSDITPYPSQIVTPPPTPTPHRLACGYAGPLVALCKLDGEEGDESIDVVIAARQQGEGR